MQGNSIMAVELISSTGEAAMPGLYFGEELAYWMYETGCAPAAIATKLGRSEDAVRKWIKQERKPDDKSIVPSIARLLGSEQEVPSITEALRGAYDRTQRDWAPTSSSAARSRIRRHLRSSS